MSGKSADKPIDVDKPIYKSNCGICWAMKPGINAFSCGHIICTDCKRQVMRNLGPEGQRRAGPVECPYCKTAVLGKQGLRHVEIVVSQPSLEERIRQAKEEMFTTIAQNEKTKSSIEQLGKQIDKKTSLLAELEGEIRRLKTINEELTRG